MHTCWRRHALGHCCRLGGPPLLIFNGRAFGIKDGEGVARGRAGWARRSGLVLPEEGRTSRDLEAAVRLPSPCR